MESAGASIAECNVGNKLQETSAHGQHSSGLMPRSVYAHGRSRSIRQIVSRFSGRRIVKYISKVKSFFHCATSQRTPLHSLVKGSRRWGDIAVESMSIQQLEKEYGEVRGRSSRCSMAKRVQAISQEHWDKSRGKATEKPTSANEFKKMEQGCKVLCYETALINKSPREVISHASARRQRQLNFTEVVLLPGGM